VWARIVDTERIDLLENTVGPALTLVTCYPFNWVGSAPKRFVVRCRPIGEPAVRRAESVVRRAESRSTVVAAGHSDGKEIAVPISAPVELTLDAGTDSMDLVLEAPARLPED
jgi:hypothetical protein